ncbi:hypothetical protein Hanom_Chr09g00777941 [Helianthus anomalus]
MSIECSVHLCQHPHSSLIFNFSNYTRQLLISVLHETSITPHLPLFTSALYLPTNNSLPATSVLLPHSNR